MNERENGGCSEGKRQHFLNSAKIPKFRVTKNQDYSGKSTIVRYRVYKKFKTHNP